MTNIDYISLQLKDVGFISTEISAFLTIAYNCQQQSKDLESQIAVTNNSRYINALPMVSDVLIATTSEEWKQWKLSL